MNKGLWMPVTRSFFFGGGRTGFYYFPVLCSRSEVDKLYAETGRLELPLKSSCPEFCAQRLADYVDNGTRKDNQNIVLEHNMKQRRNAGLTKGSKRSIEAWGWISRARL